MAFTQINKTEWEMLTANFKSGQSWADMCDEKIESVEVVKQIEPVESSEWTTVKKVTRERKPKRVVVQKKKCYFHSIGKCHFGNKCKNSHE